MKISYQKPWIPYLVIIACFLPMMSPALALCLGIFLSFLGFKKGYLHKATSHILKISVVFLGFGMNLETVIHASFDGFITTAISVTSVMLCGTILARLLKVNTNIGTLISAGTAICGGSAIAAVAPVLKSKDSENSFALIVVFVLNALALILFPLIGRWLHLSEDVFGNWAAIAIHDTSSVVGAGASYGPHALEVATTVKLIRALWIIPLTIVIALVKDKGNLRSITIPWFILLFVLAILVSFVLPSFTPLYHSLNWLGKRGMYVALFLIGSSMTISDLKQAGARSFAMGILLWIVTSVVSLMLLNS